MVYGGLAARLAQVPQWIHTEHDAWHLENAKHLRLAHGYFRFLKPLLIADAAMVARQIKQKLPGVLTDVIYNGIDTSRFCPGHQGHARSQLGLPQAGQLIGCAARLHPVKGQQRLIKILKRFPHSVKLVLAGEGETRRVLEQLASTLGVEDRVIFLGNVDDMPSFYRAIDVFCLTSDAEGLPLSPLEAQACNTPAIVTDVGGARETVCPVTGAAVALDDSHALIKAIANAFIIQSTIHPRQFIERHYDVRTMVKEYDSLAHIRWSA
jgi:glycosyltransferase involved in cell wall biosynthesis